MIPPKAGAAVGLPNNPPVEAPAGLELKSDVLPPNTGVAPVPKLVVAIGLPNADCPNGLL